MNESVPPTSLEWGFPSIKDLPQVMSAHDWSWRREAIGAGLNSRTFWIGCDTENRQWVVKMSGAYNAVREHVYAALAQSLGICTQSSVYLVLPDDAAPLTAKDKHPLAEPPQLALWFLEEHSHEPCNSECQLYRASGQQTIQETFNRWEKCVQNPWDWFDAEVLGYLCKKFEPSGMLITKSHLYVQIDNEFMFSGSIDGPPSFSLNAIEELQTENFLTLKGASERLYDLCQKILGMPNQGLDAICQMPEPFKAAHDEYITPIRDFLTQMQLTAERILISGLDAN